MKKLSELRAVLVAQVFDLGNYLREQVAIVDWLRVQALCFSLQSLGCSLDKGP